MRAKVKTFSGRKVVETIEDPNGSLWSLQVGEHTACIINHWRGRLTIKSSRETNNHSLQIRGPKDWEEIGKRWDEIKRVAA